MNKTLKDIIEERGKLSNLNISVFGCELGVKTKDGKVLYMCITPKGKIRGQYFKGNRRYVEDKDIWWEHNDNGKILNISFYDITINEEIQFLMKYRIPDIDENNNITNFGNDVTIRSHTAKVVDARIKYIDSTLNFIFY